jgi:hypothetical protein
MSRRSRNPMMVSAIRPGQHLAPRHGALDRPFPAALILNRMSGPAFPGRSFTP